MSVNIDNNKYRIILTSFGPNSGNGKIGEGIKEAFDDKYFTNKSVFVIVPKEFGVNDRLRNAFTDMGVSSQNIYISNEGYDDFCNVEDIELPDVDIIYLSESPNTYFYHDYIMNRYDEYIRNTVGSGENKLVIAASAGAICLGYNITTPCRVLGEDNIVANSPFMPYDTRGLNLLPSTTIVIPHSNVKDQNGLVVFEGELSRYEKVYHVGNDEIIILDISGNNGEDIKVIDERRINV